MKYIETEIYTAQADYREAFWDVVRGKDYCTDKLAKGRNTHTDSYFMPLAESGKYTKTIEKESLFRQIGTAVNAFDSGYRILAKDCSDLAQFVPEGGSIPLYDAVNDFTKYTVESYKLAAFVKLDEDFIHDATFDMANYLVGRLAKNFGRAETKAFIGGTGVQMPTGILHDTKGADVTLTATTLTYDDVISLYFSVKPEYRSKGVWLMNDTSAMALRKLKDADGNYLWNANSNSILGKQVILSEFMPDAQPGSKPIAFGDFSYYWVICRKPVSVRTIKEKFVTLDQIGYLAYEFLDGKLIRPDAVKVIQRS